MSNPEHTSAGMTRRSLIKRGAFVGGAMVWATPVVQSLSSPAYAAGTSCTLRLQVTITSGSRRGITICNVYPEQDPDCCDCIAEQEANGVDAVTAAFVCTVAGRCTVSPATAQSCA